MKNVLVALTVCTASAVAVSAGTVTYNTTGSTLLCGSAASCVQNTQTQITVGGITLTYNPEAGSTVNAIPFSIIQYGNLTATGAGSMVALDGAVLTINIFSTPPGASGNIPGGSLVGVINTTSSTANLTFGPDNTNSAAFGSKPGVLISGGNTSILYQVNQNTLGIVPPTPADGNPFGVTTIGGNVSDASAPEPTTVLLLGAGLGLLGLARRKRVQA